MARRGSQLEPPTQNELAETADADWQRRVVGRSLRTAAERSVDRGMNLIRAAAAVLERAEGDDITVQEVADEAGQSLRTLYQYFESKDDLLLAVFEEAMRTYAALIEQSISQLDDPVERLAGAILAAARMPEFSGPGFDRGLIGLRLRLSQTRPDLVARAQEALTTLVRGLVEAATASGRLDAGDPEAATFMILSLNAAVITAETVGNDSGAHRPDTAGLASFCLRGLGARLEGNGDNWYESVAARLRFPTPRPGRTRTMTKLAASRSRGRQRTRKEP
jgi:AcrR family transcriptional regulator